MSLSTSLRDFILAFLAILITTILVTFAIVHATEKSPDTNVLGEVGSFLQGTLGTAVALAGAFVAIRIAALSYQIVMEQKHREDFFALSEAIEAGIKPLMVVARQMRNLYGVGVAAKNVKHDIEQRFFSEGYDKSGKDEILMKIEEPLTPEEKVHFSQLSQAISNLADALDEVTTNSYAMFIWQECGKNENFLLNKFKFGEDINSLSAYNDLHEIVNLLRIRADIVRDQAKEACLGDILTPQLVANNTKDEDDNDFDNISLRDFLEIGARIWVKKTEDGKLANLGAAIIYDISLCLPESSSELESALISAFNGIAEHDFLKRIPFFVITSKLDPASWCGSSLGFVLKSVRRHKPKIL